MNIYTADSNAIRAKSPLKKLLEEIPTKMHPRALRYHRAEDAYNYVLGRILLKKGLDALGRGQQFSEIRFEENDKPVLEDVYFNISHSANMVVCVVSEQGPVGIDIEKYREIPISDFVRSFTEKEWQDIQASDSPLRSFYWYWTRKESVIKALGANLSYLHKIELDPTQDHFIDGQQKWNLKDIDVSEGFMGAVCYLSGKQ